MVHRTICNIEAFKVPDERRQRTAYGFHQTWYANMWQRKSGCGPTAVANILYYQKRKQAGERKDVILSERESRLVFMEGVWEHVTPSVHGISSARMLQEGIMSYAAGHGLAVTVDMLDIPKNRSKRPEFKSVLAFIDHALSHDIPVAFLNLNHGTQTQLDSWHWVTIVALEYERDGSTAIVTFMDGGPVQKIDLLQWFHTTTLGGGFVSMNLIV